MSDEHKPSRLKVLEFPRPESCPVCSSLAEDLIDISKRIADIANEHDDPVADMAVCVVYESGKTEHHWIGSNRFQLVGGLQHLQKMVLEEE